MEFINDVNDHNNISSSLLSPISSGSSSSCSPPCPVVVSPCAACKTLRRRCVEKCVLAPYFPPTDPLKFTTAHRVFGASNIIKLLQELPEDQRADAVNSMVYEANARLRDPVYGCAGAICQLQKQINELQAELAKARAEKLNVECQNFNLIELIKLHQVSTVHHDDDDVALTPEISPCYDQNFFFEQGNFGIGAAAWDFGANSMDTMEIMSII